MTYRELYAIMGREFTEEQLDSDVTVCFSPNFDFEQDGEFYKVTNGGMFYYNTAVGSALDEKYPFFAVIW